MLVTERLGLLEPDGEIGLVALFGVSSGRSLSLCERDLLFTAKAIPIIPVLPRKLAGSPQRVRRPLAEEVAERPRDRRDPSSSGLPVEDSLDSMLAKTRRNMSVVDRTELLDAPIELASIESTDIAARR